MDAATGAAATVIFGVTNVTQGVGGIVGTYVGGLLKNWTGDFMWYYLVIAGTAVLLGFLTWQLPREGTAGSSSRKRSAEPESRTQQLPEEKEAADRERPVAGTAAPAGGG